MNVIVGRVVEIVPLTILGAKYLRLKLRASDISIPVNANDIPLVGINPFIGELIQAYPAESILHDTFERARRLSFCSGSAETLTACSFI
jgi:hypothetical protein